jgi:hypothetical protein
MMVSKRIMMRPQFPLPRISLILALSLSCCSLWIPSSDGFKLGGQNFKLDSYTDVVRPATNHYQPETEDVGNQHKRSVRSRRTDGGAGRDSGFLSVKTIPPKVVQAREHGQALLECSVTGKPAPSVTWYKDGQPLVEVPQITLHPLHPMYSIYGSSPSAQVQDPKSMALAYAKLELDCVSPQDAGLYECRASNGQKSMDFATEIHVASFPSGNCQPRVLHQSPPQILEHYQTYMLEMFLDARLKCLTIGKHSTTWLTPSGEPVEEDGKYQIKPDGSLIIRNLDFSDMGNYACLVKNDFGSDKIETFVYPVAPN